MSNQYVSSFSGNNANDGLTPATAKATIVAAAPSVGNQENVYLSDAAPHGIASTFTTAGTEVNFIPYHEPGGADYTIQTPLEAILGRPPRVAAVLDASIHNLPLEMGSVSCRNIRFQNGPTGLGGLIKPNGVTSYKMYQGCEFTALNGNKITKAFEFMEFNNCYFHDLGAWEGNFAIEKSPTVRVLFTDCYFDIDVLAPNTGFAYAFTVRGCTIILRGSAALNFIMFTMDTATVNFLNNSVANFNSAATIWTASVSAVTGSVANNVFQGFDNGGSKPFNLPVGTGLRQCGGNSAYAAVPALDTAPAIYRTNDLNYLSTGTVFKDANVGDFRMKQSEVSNNISTYSGHVGLRGAVQADSIGGGGNIFILND